MSRVLVVDDDPTIRQILSTLLTLEGFDVATAPDGRAALAQVLETAPDLVISDVRMPHLNGYELLEAMRANPALDGVRMILLAGFADTEPGAAHARTLADACLAKPFTREHLLDTLRSIGV